MTLIEVIIVIAIIALIMSAVSFQLVRKWTEVQIEATKQEILTTRSALMDYVMRHGDQCPESLEELVEDEIVDTEPLDAWGEPLLFRCPAEKGRGVADIWSKGPDGEDGTADDICSWNIKKNRRRKRRRRAPS